MKTTSALVVNEVTTSLVSIRTALDQLRSIMLENGVTVFQTPSFSGQLWDLSLDIQRLLYLSHSRRPV